MGRWGDGRDEFFPSAPLPLPHAPCPMPHALFKIQQSPARGRWVGSIFLVLHQ
ncbi:hypothetical protein [Nostoc linckia]|uniref:hypothetical protein n=1 Tax=Nostoc linckia TaxID=92942 RepID=UPI0015D4A3A6|nr:hypothetical protein [Nostoc linckia]